MSKIISPINLETYICMIINKNVTEQIILLIIEKVGKIFFFNNYYLHLLNKQLDIRIIKVLGSNIPKHQPGDNLDANKPSKALLRDIASNAPFTPRQFLHLYISSTKTEDYPFFFIMNAKRDNYLCIIQLPLIFRQTLWYNCVFILELSCSMGRVYYITKQGVFSQMAYLLLFFNYPDDLFVFIL